MSESTTKRFGSVPEQVPVNAGKRYRAEVPARAEADALIAACSASSRTGIRNRALITILYRGEGLRISEALALRPADIDPERGTVRVMDGKGHKPRTVGLDPGAMATIQRWADKRGEAGIRGRVLLCTPRWRPDFRSVRLGHAPEDRREGRDRTVRRAAPAAPHPRGRARGRRRAHAGNPRPARALVPRCHRSLFTSRLGRSSPPCSGGSGPSRPPARQANLLGEVHEVRHLAHLVCVPAPGDVAESTGVAGTRRRRGPWGRQANGALPYAAAVIFTA